MRNWWKQELRSAGIEFVSTRVDNQDSFLEALDRFSPEIILSDYLLPAFDGESALSIAREKAPGVPFIFVTGALGEDRAVDLLKSGRHGFRIEGPPRPSSSLRQTGPGGGRREAAASAGGGGTPAGPCRTRTGGREADGGVAAADPGTSATDRDPGAAGRRNGPRNWQKRTKRCGIFLQDFCQPRRTRERGLPERFTIPSAPAWSAIKFKVENALQQIGKTPHAASRVSENHHSP